MIRLSFDIENIALIDLQYEQTHSDWETFGQKTSKGHGVYVCI